MAVTSFGGQRSESLFDVVRVQLHGLNKDEIQEVEAYVVDDPEGPLSRIP